MISAANARPDERDASKSESLIVPVDYIERRIHLVREQNVMLDSDLAILYQVTTGNLNLAVKRNSARFPSDFMFQLNEKEHSALLLQSAIATRSRGGRRTSPHVFTELGVAMLSSVLNSERAVQINILIMRAFVKMRALLATNRGLAQHIDEIEAHLTKELSRQDKKITTHEQAIVGIFNTLRELMNPPRVSVIGFTADFSKKS